MLRFSPGVDWQHVRPELLQKLNQLAAQRKVIVTLTSAYRSNQHSIAVGGFAGDPHTRGIAVDATVNGKPIGNVIPATAFAQVGLITGNQPNFFNGKPDPVHVQLPSAGTTEKGTPKVPRPTPAVVSSPSTAAPAETATTPSQPLPTAGQAVPSDTTADVFSTQPYEGAPGTGPDNRFVADLWNRIAAQPGASADSQLYAQNAALLGG